MGKQYQKNIVPLLYISRVQGRIQGHWGNTAKQHVHKSKLNLHARQQQRWHMPPTWAVVSGANSRSREYPPFCHPLREGPYRIRWWVERHLPSPSTTRKGKVQQWHVDPEVAGSSPALVNFSLFIQIYLKSVPSQFSLWFITWYLYKKVVSLYGASPTACSQGVVS